MRDLAGTTLRGRYRLIDRIGSGGMGDVYRGHDLLLDRRVAVKVLQPSLAADASFVARFKQEARAAARLSHPHVVAVHDWGSDDGIYYMVMEHVSGTDLRDILAHRGRLEPQQALQVTAAVCDALDAAHGAGLVHRDVKPENILVTPSGEVKVADFGIASIEGTATAPGGSVPGTLRYMAPEQAAGLEATGLSDVWGAGAVLAELLTGKPPPADPPALRASVTPTPPSAFVEGLAPAVDEIVLRACAVAPSQRFRGASEMAVAVRSVLGRSPSRLVPGLSLETEDPDVPFDMMPTSFAPVPGRVRRRAHRGRRRWMAGAAALVSIALGTSALAALVAPGHVPVPGVVGLGESRALEVLDESGLRGRVVDVVRSWDTAAGHVVGQSPPSGTLREGDEIELVVSAGPPKVPLPSLVGSELRAVELTLAARGSAVGKVRHVHDAAPAGTVIEQRPLPGRIPFGTAVDLVVSRGPVPVALPDVVGLASADAKRTIKAAGFRVDVVSAFSDTVAKGTVIAMDPAHPGEAPEGSTVTVTVSKGPRYAEVVMPDVRGQTVEQARARLEELELRVDVVQSCGGTGSIVSETDPISGTKIRENDLVILFVC